MATNTPSTTPRMPVGLIALALAAGLIFSLFGFIIGSGAKPVSREPEWQAVFLTNNQVYFGRLERSTGDWVELKEVYYLQSQTPQVAGSAPAASPAPQLSLVKLGGEVHGPRDAMSIPRSSILFVETLRDDSEVVKAIRSQVRPR